MDKLNAHSSFITNNGLDSVQIPDCSPDVINIEVTTETDSDKSSILEIKNVAQGIFGRP